jgi:PEP-CTERM motif
MKKMLLAAALATLGFATAANATTWTQWSDTFTTGSTSGTASGTLGGVGVSYSGELENLFFNYPSWTPTTSYVGGIVTTAPPPAGGILQLFGDQGATDTITFSSAVTNPIVAIWSLGAAGNTAQFDFTATPIFQAGGPSAEYGGASISVIGDKVFGAEGNGTVAFFGKYSSITFTNPSFENWYGFTVGTAGSVVPEPSTWAMMGLGFAGLGFAGLRRSVKARAAIA